MRNRFVWRNARVLSPWSDDVEVALHSTVPQEQAQEALNSALDPSRSDGAPFGKVAGDRLRDALVATKHREVVWCLSDGAVPKLSESVQKYLEESDERVASHRSKLVAVAKWAPMR